MERKRKGNGKERKRKKLSNSLTWVTTNPSNLVLYFWNLKNTTFLIWDMEYSSIVNRKKHMNKMLDFEIILI